MCQGSRWLVGIALLVAGCDSACDRDHPYVPYAIGDERAPADAGNSAIADAAPPSPREGDLAPDGSTQWAYAGATLVAPEGSVFVAAVPLTTGEAPTVRVAALMREPALDGAWQLADFKGERGASLTPRALSRVDSPALGEGCRALASIGRRGASSVVYELRASCQTVSDKPPERRLAWVELEPAHKRKFDATMADPAGAPSIDARLVTRDIDGDGNDDVELELSMAAPLGDDAKPLTATTNVKLSWLDRPSGLAREPKEPNHTLDALAGRAMAIARSAKGSAKAPHVARQVDAVFSALCAEGGAVRLRGAMGHAPIRCGSQASLETAHLATAEAFVKSGDIAGAALAFDRASLPPAVRSEKRRSATWKRIDKAFTPLHGATMRVVAAVPTAAGGPTTPHWGSLWFEPTGHLLVRTSSGVVRVDPETGNELAAPEVTPWPENIETASGDDRWVDVYVPCEGGEVLATWTARGSTDLNHVSLPLSAFTRRPCRASRGVILTSRPLGWGPGGLDAVCDGVPVRIPVGAPRAAAIAANASGGATPGGARSPNGNFVVFPSSKGLVVGGTAARLLTANELAGGYLELQDCAVSSDGYRVSCIRGGRAFVGIWSPGSGEHEGPE